MKFKVQDNKSNPWFAWFPVRVYDYTEEAHRTVWLETVMRAEVGHSWDRFYIYSINHHDHPLYKKEGPNEPNI
jgi:hypothetical protein